MRDLGLEFLVARNVRFSRIGLVVSLAIVGMKGNGAYDNIDQGNTVQTDHLVISSFPDHENESRRHTFSKST
jgi:hypothetical protein